MKSIICEASSIAKAIEQSWKKTGKPQNFSIKVLEVEEKNFLGMTRKPAKIAFFFEETLTPQRKKFEQKKSFDKPTTGKPSRINKESRNISGKPKTTEIKKFDKQTTTPTKAKTLDNRSDLRKAVKRSPWTDPMIDEATKWIGGILKEMNMSNIKFSVKASGNNLKFHFETPIIKHKEKQKSLFRNFAFLVMQSLRYKFKKQFRNLKAVFTSN